MPRAVLEARETGGAVLPHIAGRLHEAARRGIERVRPGAVAEPNGTRRIDGRVSATLDAQITRASIEGVVGTIPFDEADFTLAGVKAHRSPIRPDLRGGLIP